MNIDRFCKKPFVLYSREQTVFAFYKYMVFARFNEREEMSMKNDDNKIKDVRNATNLISGAYTAISGLQQTVLRSKTDAMRSERT